MVDALSEIPADYLVYEAGGLVLAFALLGFTYTSRRLMALVGRRGLWALPLLGAACMVAVVGLHFYANVWYPMEHAGDPGLTQAIYRFLFVALLALLGSSLSTVAGAVALWTSFTGFRARG